MANLFFDAGYYLARNSDVVAAGYTLATAEQHYLRYGAAESLTGSIRAPNSWFDAKAYLLAYPDLAANGVTAATALSHYLTYGLNENRRPAANVNPADFTYTDYAAANADLRTAFGITDATHLTAQQQHQLLTHFLSYGLHEARSGVDSSAGGSFFNPSNTGNPGNSGSMDAPPIIVDPVGSYTGTGGDDVFKGTDLTLNGSTLDGQGGTDTLQAQLDGHPTVVTLASIEKIAATLSADTVLNVNGSGLSAISVTGGHSLNYIGDKVDSFSLLSTDSSSLAVMTDASASNDHLDVNVGAGVTTNFTVGSIEDFAVNLGANAVLSLSIVGIDAPGATVALSGGASGTVSTFNININPAPTSLTVDGSAFAGDLTSTLDTNVSATNAMLTGGAGNDILSGAANATHTSTLDGGGGNDTLNASAGLDLLTGGSGNDTFHFGPGSGAPIDLATGAVDTVMDFSPGDRLDFTGTGIFPVAPLPFPDLASMVAAIQSSTPPPDRNVIFSVGADTYFMNTGDGTTPAAVIKLILGGGATLSNLVLDTDGVHISV